VTTFPTGTQPSAPPEPPSRPMGRIYAAVIVVQVITLLGLWWFQTAFGAR
jgi:hypothetical protein